MKNSYAHITPLSSINMNDLKVLYMKGKGSGKQSMFIDYLISQGLDIKVVDSAESVRGMSFDYVIVDEWVKEWDDESKYL